MLTVRSPLDGSLLGEVAQSTPAEVAEAVRAVRAAASSARGWGLPERAAFAGRLCDAILSDLDAVVGEIARPTARPDLEVLSGELITVFETARWLAAHAPQVLGPEPRPSSTLYLGTRFQVEYAPFGAVAVLAPWNYAVQLALVPALTALVAGNGVVLKPSELTPFAGALIERLCRAAGLPEGLLRVVQGGGEVGAQLVRARPDLVFFTGGTETGRRVAAAAAESLTPTVLELGGKDPLLAFADANFDRAVGGAVWGAFANAGQVCVSVERGLVERAVYPRFVEACARQAGSLTFGTGRDADYGPQLHPAAADRLEALVQDAVSKGARLATRFERRGQQVTPAVLADVTPEMRVWREEIFGPLLPLMPFDGEEEAVALASDSPRALGASVWTADLAKGRRVASRLKAGSVAVNDVIKQLGNPSTPFGGDGESGWGRYHGPEGLRAFSKAKTVAVSPGLLSREPNWFPYTGRTYAAVAALAQAQYGSGDLVGRGRKIGASLLEALRAKKDPRKTGTPEEEEP